MKKSILVLMCALMTIAATCRAGDGHPIVGQQITACETWLGYSFSHLYDSCPDERQKYHLAVASYVQNTSDSAAYLAFHAASVNLQKCLAPQDPNKACEGYEWPQFTQ